MPKLPPDASLGARFHIIEQDPEQLKRDYTHSWEDEPLSRKELEEFLAWIDEQQQKSKGSKRMTKALDEALQAVAEGLLDVCDRGDPTQESLGKARNLKQAAELAVAVYRCEGYPDPQVYSCELIPAGDGHPAFFEVEVTYRNDPAACPTCGRITHREC